METRRLFARHPRAKAPLVKAAKFLSKIVADWGLLDPEPTERAGATLAKQRDGFTINHVGLCVRDIDAFLAANQVLYRNFRKTESVVNERQKVREVFLTDGNHVVELLEPIGETSPLNNFLRKNRAGGLVHICFECDDIQAAIVSIKDAGGILITGPVPDIAFEERPIAFLMLADQVIELVQRPSAAAAG